MANTKVTTNVIADDAITGAKIADDAINSEHYTDGSIDTAHIADDQVTLAKMAGLARGKIIYGDSSGNPAALAVGSNGQVLKSDGTDIAWGTDSSGVALDDISTGDAATTLATSAGNITIDAQGNDTDIIFKGTDGSSDTTFLTLDGSEAGTATFNSGVVVGGDITKGSGEFKIKNTANGENVGIYTTSSSSEVHALKIHSGGNVEIKSGSLVAPGGATISKAGDGNTPVLHVTDSADTEVAWFEGNRAGDTGAFISVRHNPSSQANSNRSGIKFQADDDAGNVTNYARITQYISDNSNGTEDGSLAFNVMKDGTDTEMMKIDSGITLSGNLTMMSNTIYANQAYVHDRLGHLNDADTYIDFAVDGITFAAGGAAAYVTSAGKFYIGTSSPALAGTLSVEAGNAGVPVIWAKNTNADSVGIRSQVNSNVAGNYIYYAVNSGGGVWQIRNDGDHQGTDTSIGSLSDSRLKKDVSDLTYDIDKFKQYRPIEFNWINPELHKAASGKSRGFLAQEVKALDDYYVDQYDAEGADLSLVDADKKAYSTKFGYKDAMYISVIKQLITRLEAAEAKITALEG